MSGPKTLNDQVYDIGEDPWTKGEVPKLEKGKYYKHDNCRDVFIQVWEVGEKEGEYNVLWFTEGTQGNYHTLMQWIKIDVPNASRWLPHTPKEFKNGE